ncbi:hypothetical protein KRX51_00060 [Corynebacterium sp. TAE3-ERU12]|uniref:hypothetical protein n=1 Tax=Corynebacterium sp. TAE3-ERU12 TaxID=2849491 RepID=UPI001C4577AA|nr:hypothetical protein [Corynebacterium sp. TAE3-ERU12]MBV7294319.1 hypothetical protein [Corynebacterium sp. TAE3-ERU12]
MRSSMDMWMFVTMGCVLVGFLMFGGSFAAFMYGRSRTLVWGLALGAMVLCTIIPTTIAVLWGARGG